MAVKIYKALVSEKAKLGEQTNSYIVIHNSGGGDAKSVRDYFAKNAGPNPDRADIYAHYTIDDKEGYQCLLDNWKGQHTSGNGYVSSWTNKQAPANNSNAIGIEVADGCIPNTYTMSGSVNLDLAIENCIELVRYLMQAYSIPIGNVVRHGDTQKKECPYFIMKAGKWQYMLDEIKKRNEANQPVALDISELDKSNMVASDPNSSVSGTTLGSSGSGSGSGNLFLTFNNTTTTQESLPNANVSDNWVDMHKIKGITLHMYPPYHNCVADSMVKSFEALGWDRNFHYKVDKDTVVDFDAEPVSGEGTGGNKVGSSVSVFEVTPKDPLNYGVIIDANVTNADGSGGSGGSGVTGDSLSATVGGTIDGNDIPSKIYNYCVSQGCSCAAACGVVGNAQVESGFSTTIVNKSSGATGLFQWLGGRLTALKQKASAAGKDYTDADIQIQHMWAEFCGEDSTTLSLLNKRCGGVEGFKKLSSAGEAGKLFGSCFERAGDNGSTRAKAAEEWYSKFSQMQNSGGSSDTGQNATPLSLTPTAEITPKNVWYQDNSGITEEDLNKPAAMPELGEDVPASDGIMTVDSKPKPFGWPIPGQKYVQSYFGYRSDTLGYKFHSGIDIVNYPLAYRLYSR